MQFIVFDKNAQYLCASCIPEFLLLSLFIYHADEALVPLFTQKADDNSPALLFVFFIFTIANIFAIDIFAITGTFTSTFELRIVKVIIEPVLRQKLFMRTLFDNVTLVHNEYDVGVFDGR